MSRRATAEAMALAGVIGHRIRTLRLGRDMSQAELAIAIGHLKVSGTGYIHRVEYGEKDLSVSTLLRFADAFGLTLSELLQGVDDERK